jgi:hypothetical protein
MVECRICLETGLLLTDACNCRGSLSAIHINCLQKSIYYSRSLICSICKSLYKITPDKALKNPKLWIYLDTPVFEFCIRLILINIIRFEKFAKIAFSFNLLLLGVYFYAYYNILKETMKYKTFKLWLTPILNYQGQYYFPLVLLGWTILSFFQPLIMIFFYPYNRLYEVHKKIIFTIG